MVKLFTIGDSISQGFMSGAAAQTNLSYSTLLAKKLGILPADYFFPSVWQNGGLPVNIENILRALNKRYGSNIRGTEWLTLLTTINSLMDVVEDYYERGAGGATIPTPGVTYYHNVAVRGFDVANAWNIDAATATHNIKKDAFKTGRDALLFGLPSASFHRTALKVLNPSLDPAYKNYTQLDWLNHHVSNSGGVENLCLWLGANNALGTILSLTIKQTPGNGSPVSMSSDERMDKGWNLWHPKDFEAEYEELLKRTDAIMRKNAAGTDWRVFVATIPYVTIAPLTKGVGPTTKVGGDVYYKYYTYFPFTEEFAHKTNLYLNIQQALHIDGCIKEYNAIINRVIANYNAKHGTNRYFIVDIAKVLHDMAWKRNDAQPTYKFPPFFKFLYPKVDTKYYDVDRDGNLKQGGIFSLDGVHPSAIGQGLIAHEFIQKMKAAGVSISDFADTEWQEILDSDTLYNYPITLMGELYEHERLAQFIVQSIKFFED